MDRKGLYSPWDGIAGMEKYIVVGRLGKVHGLGGFLRLRMDEDRYLDDALQAGVLFVGDERAPLPYFIAQIKEDPTLLVQFDEVENREAAEVLAGEALFLRERDLSEAVVQKPLENDLAYLIGFMIEDVNTGPVGSIDQVEEYPQQWMAILTYADRELMIPLHDDLIEEVDAQRNVIRMNLPEGLLDL